MTVSSFKPVASYIADVLTHHLQIGEKVTWLLSGGSCAEANVAVANALRKNDVDVSRLSVSLVDERYGLVGHADENYQHLMDGGFSLPGAKFYRILNGENREKTVKLFTNNLHEILGQASFSLGFFGIGADGHTAGIKPHSPAVAATDLATDYTWEDYDRITMTAPAIAKLDEIVVYAIGQEKWPTLRKLLDEEIPFDEMPAQVLKKISGKKTLFTDMKEE